MFKLIIDTESIYENFDDDDVNIEALHRDCFGEGNTMGFNIVINDKKLFYTSDWSDASLSHWHFVREVNRAFIELIRKGETSLLIEHYKSTGRLAIEMKLTKATIEFDVNDNREYTGWFKHMLDAKDEKVSITEAIEEAIQFVKSYKDLFKDILKNDSQEKIKEYAERKINVRPGAEYYEEALYDWFFPEKWESLEEIWKQYKSEHGIA